MSMPTIVDVDLSRVFSVGILKGNIKIVFIILLCIFALFLYSLGKPEKLDHLGVSIC